MSNERMCDGLSQPARQVHWPERFSEKGDSMNRPITRRRQIVAALLLAVVSVVSATRATTLARMNLVQLSQAADTVVRARCSSTSARWEDGAIWTFSEFDVTARFKGNAAPHIQVRSPGGRVGHISTRVEDAPQFRPGDDAVLFLEATADGSYAVSAWAEGTFRIRKGPGAVDLVTQDSSGVAIFEPSTRQFRSDGIRNLVWGEFQRRLVDALSRPSAGGSR
jgi:hypothetical protein